MILSNVLISIFYSISVVIIQPPYRQWDAAAVSGGQLKISGSPALTALWLVLCMFMLLCVCVCVDYIVCTFSHVTKIKLVIDSGIMPQWQQWLERISMFVCPFVCPCTCGWELLFTGVCSAHGLKHFICVCVCVCVFCMCVCLLPDDPVFSCFALPPLFLSLLLLPYSSRRRSVGALVKKVLILINRDMTSWHH